MGKIRAYELLEEFKGDEIFVVETDKGTKSLSVSAIKEHITTAVEEKADMLNQNSIDVIENTGLKYVLDIMVGSKNITTPNLIGPPGADGKDYILTQQDKDEIAGLARIGALTIKTVSDDEALEEQLLYLSENLSAVSPCFLITLYDATATLGTGEGSGLFIIDSGNGVFDDAYIIPYCSNEISYTYADKDRIDTSYDFANSYPEKTRWKELKAANNAQVSYADGTALVNMKIREAVFSLTLELLEDFAAQRYSAFGIEVNGVSRIIEMPRIFEQPNSSLTVNAHIILHQNGYILKVLWCNDERTVTTVYDIPGSKNFGLWDISTMYVKNTENDADYHLNKTLNYIYGRC